MSLRSQCFALIFSFVASAACSNADAGFTTSGQGGASAAGHSGALASAGMSGQATAAGGSEGGSAGDESVAGNATEGMD